MNKYKIEINITDFPSELHELLLAGDVFDSSCSSNATTLYCDAGYYIKIDEKGELALEAALCDRFFNLGLGVKVIQYISTDKDYLVTQSAIGEDLTHYLENPTALCDLLASSLLRLHSQPVDGAFISTRFQRYLDSANGDFSGGYYDKSVLMDGFRIHSKQEAWDIMQANKGRLRADTLIHGDACLPNVIAHNGLFDSFIDLGMAGAGDKHIDLYWAIWSLQYNLKTNAYTDYFLNQYGRENFEYDMLKAIAAFELFG